MEKIAFLQEFEKEKDLRAELLKVDLDVQNMSKKDGREAKALKEIEALKMELATAQREVQKLKQKARTEVEGMKQKMIREEAKLEEKKLQSRSPLSISSRSSLHLHHRSMSQSEKLPSRVPKSK
jgi:hypothetical protein